MPDPDYEWVCQSCKAANPPGSGQCAACGFSARFTVPQLDAATGVDSNSYKGTVVDLMVWVGIIAASVLIYWLEPDWAQKWLSPHLVIALIAIAVFAITWIIQLIIELVKALLVRR
jgi:hypothetical protein